jgi:hypothetical protein
MNNLILIFILFSGLAFAQKESRNMDIDLMSFCKDSSRLEEDEIIDLEKSLTCKKIKELEGKNIPPITLDKKDEQGNLWKLRFHFGFSRTDYAPTDLHIKSDVINIVIKDVVMHERTSAHHYNPGSWAHIDEAGQWIDEPTNTFTFSLEKNKNIFYLTIFHPKYLKSLVYSTTEVNGEPQYTVSGIQESDDFSVPIPEGQKMLYLGNTHMNLIWQVGYGRQFVIFDTKAAGKLSYTVKGDVGINFGEARSVHIIPGVSWDDYIDKPGIQGINASIGHRLEYQRGRVSLFVDQKTIYSKMEHGFYDGTINYNLRSTPTTFGIGIDIFTKKKHK